MAHLAIRGHATRGKEVIEILEMLGGTMNKKLLGTEKFCGYYINSNGNIDYRHYSYLDDAIHFTLEKFLKKFPYKVGDKVYNVVQNENQTITNLIWDPQENEIVYQTNYNEYVYVNYLQPYKEAPMYLNAKANKQAEEIKKILEPVKEIMEEIKLDIPDGYEFFGIGDDNKIVLTKKQPQYPKTYIECAKELGYNRVMPTDHILGYKGTLLSFFQQLLICRDAYWKIAGEQMGLGEPWKPDWLNVEQDKFVLYTHNNVICLTRFVLRHNVLAFPTAEMRDAFLENFKELIEHVKELL
jgi:hypothetical protein